MSEAYALHVLQQENIRLKDENRLLQEQLTQLRYAISALSLIDKSLNTITPETDVLALINQILAAALQAVGAESGSLLLLDEETDELVFVDVIGSQKAELLGYRMPANQGIVGAALSKRAPLLVPDVRQDPRWYSQVDDSFGHETRSIMCVPVMDDGRVLGAIEVINKQGNLPFNREDLEILRLVARLSSLALAKAEEVTRDEG